MARPHPVVFRAARVWWKAGGWLLFAVGCLWAGYDAFADGRVGDRVLFASSELTKWLGGLLGLLLGIGSATIALGPWLGVPRLELQDDLLRSTDLFGRRRDLDLSAYGPAHVFRSKSPGHLWFAAFYAAEKDRALRQSGKYDPPNDFTADTRIDITRLIGAGQSADDIAEAINNGRTSALSQETIDPTLVAAVIQKHRRRVLAGGVFLIFLSIAAAFLASLLHRLSD